MSIKAYATVRLTGCNIRRFINLCTANHIKIWNLKYVSPKEYEACCSTEDIFLMKPHLKKTHTRLLVVKRQGYFAIRAFYIKYVLLRLQLPAFFVYMHSSAQESGTLCLKETVSRMMSRSSPLWRVKM